MRTIKFQFRAGLFFFLGLAVGSSAMAAENLKKPCSNNYNCKSNTCDRGDGTSKTGTCVPADGTGKAAQYCTNNRNCKSGKCSGHNHPPRHNGVCLGNYNVSLEGSCSGNSDCKSRTCDKGNNTSRTETCVPADGTGGTGQYCTNKRNCASGLCSGHAKPFPHKGTCTQMHSKALKSSCTNHVECKSGVCDGGTSTCVHANKKGGRRDYCTADDQCSSDHCASLISRPTGTCGPAEPSVGSYVDKTRIYIRNNTNQTLHIGAPRKTGGSISFGAGRHFYAKNASGAAKRYSLGSDHLPLMEANNKIVPPGELVQVLWFQRAGLPNNARYRFRTAVSVKTGVGTKRVVVLKQRVTGKTIGSAMYFGLASSNWKADTKWHRRNWRVPSTKVAGVANVDQKFEIKYRGLQKPGVGGDVEYVFVGPDPKVKFSFPVHPRTAIATGGLMGPAHMDHNPHPRTSYTACSDYKGRGNGTLQGALINCYGGHEGSDFMLAGGFGTMQSQNTYVIAAAAGKVTYVSPGNGMNFDKCGYNFGSIDSVDRFFEVLAKVKCTAVNKVHIDHGSGISTQYLHMKKGSLRVATGQTVACGEILGEIGSSGNSIAPHLHFNVIDNQAWVDPFKGGETNRSYWQQQTQPLPASIATCGAQSTKPF